MEDLNVGFLELTQLMKVSCDTSTSTMKNRAEQSAKIRACAG